MAPLPQIDAPNSIPQQVLEMNLPATWKHVPRFAVLAVLLSTGARAGVHPVPLEKNVAAANCLECDSSDDNRYFGGTGPNGPHGSINSHNLERNYQVSQAAEPGGVVTNSFPNPDLTVTGPNAMCAKCHDLTKVVANISFAQHSPHTSQYGSFARCAVQSRAWEQRLPV